MKEKSTFDKILGLVKLALVAAVVLVCVTSFGGIARVKGWEMPKFENSKVVPQFNYNVDQDILDAMATAEQAAKQYASAAIDEWIGEMMGRTEGFLDDYFSFTNVKAREVSAAGHFLVNLVFKNQPTASEAAMQDLEENISQRVVKPAIAQQKVENITNGAVAAYMKTFDRELLKVQAKHNIPTPEWNKHVARLCGLTAEYDTKKVPIATKLFLVSSGVLTVKVAAPVITKIGQKVGQKMVAKAGTKAAGASGAKSVGKMLPKAGMCICAAVVVWDLYDYSRTADQGRRELREGFGEYFQEIKAELLGPTEDSIMGAIYMWENDLRARM